MKQMSRVSRLISVVLIAVLALLFLTAPCFAYNGKGRVRWQEHKSDHFIIYYNPDIPSKYVREFTRKCEKYYHEIADRLGFRRFDYWSWDNRGRIFIYGSREAYTKDRGRPHWSAASTQPKKKTIATYYFAEDFFNTILPHELTHIILREYIGYNSKVPLWFEEGVACANEDKYTDEYLLKVRELLDQKIYLSVDNLDKINSTKVLNMATRTDEEFPWIFYSTSAALVMFLQEEYGRSNFIKLYRYLRDANTFYGAINKAYHIRNKEELNNKFLSFLQQ